MRQFYSEGNQIFISLSTKPYLFYPKPPLKSDVFTQDTRYWGLESRRTGIVNSAIASESRQTGKPKPVLDLPKRGIRNVEISKVIIIIITVITGIWSEVPQ